MRQKSKEQTQRQLGAAIKRCRIERGMSRRDLQEATGRSYPYLSEIEAGKKAPSTEVLGEIAAALDMEMHELIEQAERGREPRGWVAPRQSHFHRASLPPEFALESMPAPASALPPESESVSSPASPSRSSGPIDELIQLASMLPRNDLNLLIDIARRMTD